MMRSLVAGGGVAIGGLVLLGGAVLGGFVPLPGSAASSARPPCRSLPTTAEVSSAIADHPEVTDGLRSAAPGVRVSVSEPCSGRYTGRALVRVRLGHGDARQRVEDWLNTHDGYGVPLEIED